MAGAIGPGDWVEAIRDLVRVTPRSRLCGRLEKGSVHQVASTFMAWGVCGECGAENPVVLILPGTSEGGAGWCPCAVKPIYRPKSELLESLLTKADEAICEDA